MPLCPSRGSAGIHTPEARAAVSLLPSRRGRARPSGVFPSVGIRGMIISRTPFRISFVGGGTDLRSFYAHEPGQVLSTSIDKYLYVVVRRQMGLVEHKYRVNYSRVEFTKTIDEIEHPIVREALKLYKIDYPVE